MRLIAAAVAAVVITLGCVTPSLAGLLELPFDRISRDRHCDSAPCRDNNLHYKRVWTRDRYLRFDIHTRQAQYALRRVRVMVDLPGIALTGCCRERDWFGFGDLVALPSGPYRVVRRPQYEWVTKEVLVHPEEDYVTRRRPYYAYYPDTIVVTGE